MAPWMSRRRGAAPWKKPVMMAAAAVAEDKVEEVGTKAAAALDATMEMSVSSCSTTTDTETHGTATESAREGVNFVTLEGLDADKEEEVEAAGGGTDATKEKADAAVLEEELAGKNTATGTEAEETLGDMEVTLRAIKPSSVSTPSQHTDKQHGDDGSSIACAALLKDGDGPSTSSCSPTSQFEYDIMDATHQTLDFDILHKSRSFALMDDGDESISSEEESLQERNEEDSYLEKIDEESFISADVPTHNENEYISEFVDDVLSPFTNASDFMFCRLQCAFPDGVKDLNEILSNEMHHVFFQGEGEKEVGEEARESILLNDWILQSDEAGDDIRGKEEEDRLENGGVEVVFGPSQVEWQGEGGVGQDEGVDEQAEEDEQEEDEEGGEEVVVDGQKDSKEVEVVMGRWSVMQSQLENASYSPGAGFFLRKDLWLPKVWDNKVLIRVDVTTISTRDCLERLRRDITEELKDDIWVPGHEIVGSVVRAGTNAEFLLDKRVAAVLPYGGGCSQYVCIDAEDAIALPEEADSSEDVVALMSTYMTAYQCLESVAGIAPEEEGDVESVAESIESKKEEDVEPEESPLIADDDGQKKSPLFGKNVLIIDIDAGSPVGLALDDLARNAGATVYTVSHISYLSAIRWSGEMDLIVDTVGDSNNHSSFNKVMKTRGQVVRVNTTSCEKKYVPLKNTQGDQDTSYYGRVINDKAIDYDIFKSFHNDKELFTKDLVYLHELLKAGKIGPKIFSRVGLDKLEGEWETLIAGGASGVVVASPWKLGFTTVRG